MDEAGETLLSEFGQRTDGLLQGFLGGQLRLGEELVSIADDLFLDGLW